MRSHLAQILIFMKAIAVFGTCAPVMASAERALEVVKPVLKKEFENPQSSAWMTCIAAAEKSRSSRDLEFFIRATKLSDSKSWFVSHSTANEARFCLDVALCKKKYGERYYNAPKSYPTC